MRWYFLLFLFCFSLLASEERGKFIISVSPKIVGCYERVDIDINLNASFSNPFDPEEADISIELKTPKGKTIIIPAFYYQPYERKTLEQDGRKLDWIYPIAPPHWKARFTPKEAGRYQCTAVLKTKNRVLRSNTESFTVKPRKHHGFVTISSKDPRFFSFEDGTLFFPIGQNLAFIGPMQYVNLVKAEEIFKKLADNGANYLRIWVCCDDWAIAIESQKSAFGRSWGPKPPLAPMPGEENKLCLQIGDEAVLSVEPSHPVALRPNATYLLSGRLRSENPLKVVIERNGKPLGEPISLGGQGEWIPFQREFTTSQNEWWLGSLRVRKEGKGKLLLADLSLKEKGDGVELLWEADVNRPIMGFYNQVDCFMIDEIVSLAERYGIHLQLCLLTRNLYMDKLKNDNSPEYEEAISYAKKLLRYAVARWGYSTSVVSWEYWNEQDPNLPTERFYNEMGSYLEQIDPYRHLRATSAWAPTPRDWANRKLDVADLHWYLRPNWNELWKDAVGAVQDRAQLLRKYATEKPALLSEFGLADEQWRLSPYMEKDEELLHFHDALWASALSGLSGTAMFWWWEKLDMMNAYHHYKPLSIFTSDIPFASGLQSINAQTSDEAIRVIGLQGKDRAYIFLSDKEAGWYSVVVEKIKPRKREGISIIINGLSPGKYKVQWFDTYQGKVLEEKIVKAKEKTLQISAPPFLRDIACKILRIENR
ncbi:DUF5060 domain-containing protein [bacterium]|nr:DUF5060 domain-containing protein [bacterium]